MPILYQDSLTEVNWHELKADLAADQFDNGRSPEQLQTSFENSAAVCLACAAGSAVAVEVIEPATAARAIRA